MSDNPNDEDIQCNVFYGGKCKDIKNCMYKDLSQGHGRYTLNNFRMELIKSLVDIIYHVDELDTEYENTLMFNSSVYKIKLKIEKA